MARRQSRTKRPFLLRRRLLIEQLGERCVLAAITGEVFNDLNESLNHQSSEPLSEQRLVFLDVNQNRQLDFPEPVALSSSEGQFEFEGLQSGEYFVHLFRGGPQQQQTFPAAATAEFLSDNAINATQLVLSGDYWYSLNTDDSSIEYGELQSSDQTEVLVIDGSPERFDVLPDGRLFVVGSVGHQSASWIVDPSQASIQLHSFELQNNYLRWSGLSLNDQGQGLVVAEGDETWEIFRVDYSPIAGVEIDSNSITAEVGTHVVASEVGQRNLIARANDEGLVVSLLSQTTGEMIIGSTQPIEGASEVIAFDDATGILLVRDHQNRVTVLDVDANFSPINQIFDVAGPLAFDATTHRLVSISEDFESLQLHDVIEGKKFAEIEVDLQSVGVPSELAWSGARAISVLGDSGLVNVQISQPIPHRVVLNDDDTTSTTDFGVLNDLDNHPPYVPTEIKWTLAEDTVLVVGASELMSRVIDPESNQLVVLQQSEASNGVAIVQYDGSLFYQPNEHFYGTESVQVRVHDGQVLSDPITLTFEVTPVPDPPNAVRGRFADMEMDSEAGELVGSLEVLDPDQSGSYDFSFSDSRFGVDGSNLIYLGGDLDYQNEPTIGLSVTVYDAAADSTFTDILHLNVRDPNGPQLNITPDSVQVAEDTVDALVTTLSVEDPEYFGSHTLEIDDERFRLEGKQLHLNPGVSLDFESEPVIVLVVTATRDTDPGVSVREVLVIHVTDVAEQPESMHLTNRTVDENVYGAIVGRVLIDGGTPSERFQFSVNDPRFELAEGVLKLLDQTMVERNSQTEIEIVLTVHDQQSVFSPLSATFVIQVNENANPHHNADNPYDVDRSGSVTALDALAIINYLNIYGPGPVRHTNQDYAYDVNADALVTSLDVLLVLNELNRQRLRAQAVSSGEQVESPTDQTPAMPQDSGGTDSLLNAGGQGNASIEAFSDLDLSSGDSKDEGAMAENQWSGPLVDDSLRVVGSDSNEFQHDLSLDANQVDETLDLLSSDNAREK